MRRREFIAGLAGAAVWTATARAQQLPVVGYFHPGTPTGSVSDQTAAFRKGLAEVGFVEGRNVTVEYSYGNNDNDRITELIGDLARRRLNVLVVISAGSALAAKAITTTVPIVFLTAVDPVQLGLVAGFGRPGGNLTGISVLTAELGAKRLQVMRDMLPAAARFALLVSSLDGQIQHQKAGERRVKQERQKSDSHETARGEQRQRHRGLITFTIFDPKKGQE
jgi:putative ABC transport system substrate-binding protein